MRAGKNSRGVRPRPFVGSPAWCHSGASSFVVRRDDEEDTAAEAAWNLVCRWDVAFPSAVGARRAIDLQHAGATVRACRPSNPAARGHNFLGL